MLNEMRAALRISHNKLDDEIIEVIESCLLELKRVGVDTSKQDALTNRAIEHYVRWQFDYNNKGDVYEKRFNDLRDALSLTQEYKVGDNNVL